MADLSGLVEDNRAAATGSAEVVSTPTELHRARLRELEERQRRLQQLCQAALQYSDNEDNNHHRDNNNDDDDDVAAASIPENVIDDDGEEPAAATTAMLLERQKMLSTAAATGMRSTAMRRSPHAAGTSTREQEGEQAATRRTFLSSPPPGPALEGSRGGRIAQDDLLTGEVQSFRDPASMARNSSVNSNLIRAPSLGMTAQATAAAGGATTTAKATMPPPHADMTATSLRPRERLGTTRYTSSSLPGAPHVTSTRDYATQHVRPTLYPLPSTTTATTALQPPPPPSAANASSSSLFASNGRANEKNASSSASWRARLNARQYTRTRATTATAAGAGSSGHVAGRAMMSPGMEEQVQQQQQQQAGEEEEGGAAHGTMSVAALRAKYGVAANTRRRSDDTHDHGDAAVQDNSAVSGSGAAAPSHRRRYTSGLSAPPRETTGAMLSPAANATMAGLFGSAGRGSYSKNNNNNASNSAVSYNDPLMQQQQQQRRGTQARMPPPPPPPTAGAAAAAAMSFAGHAERNVSEATTTTKAKRANAMVSPMPYNSLREKYGLKPQRALPLSPPLPSSSNNRTRSESGLSSAARQYFAGGNKNNNHNNNNFTRTEEPAAAYAHILHRPLSPPLFSASIRSGASSRYAPQHYFRDNTADPPAFRALSSRNNSLSYSGHTGARPFPPPPPPPPATTTPTTSNNTYQRLFSSSHYTGGNGRSDAAFARRSAWEKYSIGRSTTAEEEDRLRRYFAREETDLSWSRHHHHPYHDRAYRRSVSQPASSSMDLSYGMFRMEGDEGGAASRSRAHTLEARRRGDSFMSPPSPQPQPQFRAGTRPRSHTRRAAPPPPPPPLPTARDDITGLVEDPSETMSSALGRSSDEDDEYDSALARDEQTARPGYSPGVSAGSTPNARGFAQAEGADGMMYSAAATPNAPPASAYRVSHEATRHVMQGHDAEAAAGLRGFLHVHNDDDDNDEEEEEEEDEGVMEQQSELEEAAQEERTMMPQRTRKGKARRKPTRRHEEEEEEEVLSAVGQDMYGRMHATLLHRRPPMQRKAAKAQAAAFYHEEGMAGDEEQEDEDNIAMGESASLQSTPVHRRPMQGHNGRGKGGGSRAGRPAHSGPPRNTANSNNNNNNNKAGQQQQQQQQRVPPGQGKGKRPAQPQPRKRRASVSPRPLSAAQVRQPRPSRTPSAQRTETSEPMYTPPANEEGESAAHGAERAEALARHLVKAIFDKKLLQDQVEQLEQLVEESSMEVGRLQNIVEAQDDAAGTVQGVQAALRAKENELAVCEAEIERLHNIFQAHLTRITPSLTGNTAALQQEQHGSAVVAGERAVMQASELEAAFIEVGVARVAQRAAEDKATQLASELESAVEQIQMLDSRLAEMERGAAAQRLQEVRLRLGTAESVDEMNDHNNHNTTNGRGVMSSLHSSPRPREAAQQQPQPQPQQQMGRDSVESLRTTLTSASTAQDAALRVPSANEAILWPLAARRALAQLVSHAEGLLVQNAESARSASVRLQHVEHDSRALRQALQVKHEELQALQRECAALRQEKTALRLCGEQWYTLLSAVKEEATLVSELVATSRKDAEELALRAHVAASQRAVLGGPVSAAEEGEEDGEYDEEDARSYGRHTTNTSASSPPPLRHHASPLPVLRKGEGRLLQDAAVHAALVAQDASVQQSQQFARQVMRDLNVVARFLFALREMDIGGAADYEALVSLANNNTNTTTSASSPAALPGTYGTPDNASAAGHGGNQEERKNKNKKKKMLAQLTASQMAILEEVQARRDFVLQAVEQALAQGGGAGAELPTRWPSLQRRPRALCDDDDDGEDSKAEDRHTPLARHREEVRAGGQGRGSNDVRRVYEQTGKGEEDAALRAQRQRQEAEQQQQQNQREGQVHEPSPLSEVDESELRLAVPPSALLPSEAAVSSSTHHVSVDAVAPRDMLSSTPEVDRTLPPPLPAAPALSGGHDSPPSSRTPSHVHSHASPHQPYPHHHNNNYASDVPASSTPPASLQAETEEEDEAYYTSSPNLHFHSPTTAVAALHTPEQRYGSATLSPRSETQPRTERDTSAHGAEGSDAVKRKLAMTELRASASKSPSTVATAVAAETPRSPSQRTEGSALPARRSLTARPSMNPPHSAARISLDVEEEEDDDGYDGGEYDHEVRGMAGKATMTRDEPHQVHEVVAHQAPQPPAKQAEDEVKVNNNTKSNSNKSSPTQPVMPAVLEVDRMSSNTAAQPRRLQSPPREPTQTTTAAASSKPGHTPNTAHLSPPAANTSLLKSPAHMDDDDDANEPSLQYMEPALPAAASMTIPSIMTADNTMTTTMTLTAMFARSTTANTSNNNNNNNNISTSTTANSVGAKSASRVAASQEPPPTPPHTTAAPATQPGPASHPSRQRSLSNLAASAGTITEGLGGSDDQDPTHRSLGGVALPRLQRSLTVSRASAADLSPTTPPVPHTPLSSATTTHGASRPPSRQNSMHRESSTIIVESVRRPARSSEEGAQAGNALTMEDQSGDAQDLHHAAVAATAATNHHVEREAEAAGLRAQSTENNNNNNNNNGSESSNSRQPSLSAASALVAAKPAALPPRRTAMSAEAVRDLTHGPGLPALHPSNPSVPPVAPPASSSSSASSSVQLQQQQQQKQPREENTNKAAEQTAGHEESTGAAPPPPVAPAPVQPQANNNSTITTPITTTGIATPPNTAVNSHKSNNNNSSSSSTTAWTSAASMYYSFSTGQPRARSPIPSTPPPTLVNNEHTSETPAVPRLPSAARLRSVSLEDKARPQRRSDSLDTLHEAAPRETLASSRLQTAIDLLDEEEDEEEEEDVMMYEGKAHGAALRGGTAPMAPPSLLVRVSPPPSIAPLPPLPSPRSVQAAQAPLASHAAAPQAVTSQPAAAAAGDDGEDSVSSEEEDEDEGVARTCISAATESMNETTNSHQPPAQATSSAYAPAQSAATTMASDVHALRTPTEATLETATSQTPHTTELSSLTTSPPSREVSRESTSHRSPSGSYSAGNGTGNNERRRAEVDSILERLRAQKERRRSKS